MCVACGSKGGGAGDGLTPIGDSPVRIKLPEGAKMVQRGDHWSAEGGPGFIDVQVKLGQQLVSDYSLNSKVNEAKVVGDLDARFTKNATTGLITFSVIGNPTSDMRKDLFFVETWLPDDKGTATWCYGVGKGPSDPSVEACRSLTSTVKPAAKPDTGPAPPAPAPPKP